MSPRWFSCFVAFFVSVSLITGCARSAWVIGGTDALLEPEGYDVVVKASPIKVKPYVAKSAVHAIEGGPVQMRFADHTVVFEIDSVLYGNLPMQRAGGASRFEQAQDAAEDRNLLKLLTFDFSDPDEEVEMTWMSVAVIDAKSSFGVGPEDDLSESTCKLYLKRVPETQNSFIMVGSKYRT